MNNTEINKSPEAAPKLGVVAGSAKCPTCREPMADLWQPRQCMTCEKVASACRSMADAASATSELIREKGYRFIGL